MDHIIDGFDRSLRGFELTDLQSYAMIRLIIQRTRIFANRENERKFQDFVDIFVYLTKDYFPDISRDGEIPKGTITTNVTPKTMPTTARFPKF